MLRRLIYFLLIMISVKLVFVFFTNQLLPDPRRDIDSKLKLMKAFKPNTVFIGTSRTLFGIDPEYFDSLSNYHTRSYNLGLLSLSPASSLQIAEKLLHQEDEIDHIFIELSALDFNTTLLRPSNSWEELCFRINMYSKISIYNTKQKLTFFLNALNLAVFRSLLITGEIVKIKKYFSPPNDPIEGQSNIENEGNQLVGESISTKSEILEKNRISTLAFFEAGENKSKNEFFVSKINHLIALAKSKNRTLLFYIPNKFTENERVILQDVIGYIPLKNRAMPRVATYKDSLFELNHLFDDHHLNSKGARIYTKMLSASVDSSMQNQYR